MDESFLRAGMLLGAEALDRLRRSHVAVFGLGGVGSWCAEALARSGVGELTLVDQDELSRSNINRQSLALHSTLGLPKAEVCAARMLDINPDIITHPIRAKYEAASREDFFRADYDYIVDAIDLVACKLDLIQTALARDIPIISALGTGNKFDASRLEICDVSKTIGCPLSRVVRKELRRRGITKLTVLYSSEEAARAEQTEAPPPGRRSVPGSVVWVPACAGMMLAGHVVMALLDARR